MKAEFDEGFRFIIRKNADLSLKQIMHPRCSFGKMVINRHSVQEAHGGKIKFIY